MKTILPLIIILKLTNVSCQTKTTNTKQEAIINAKTIEVTLKDGLAKAYLQVVAFGASKQSMKVSMA